MYDFIDHKYMGMISSQLRNYSKKTKDSYNFSCPICKDSQKNVRKARGYMFYSKGKFLYKCHNCNLSCLFGHFLKLVDPIVHKDYVLEKFKNGNVGFETNKEEKEMKFAAPKFSKSHRLKGIDKVTNFSVDHPIRKYLTSRKIPKEQFHRLYYTDNFTEWVLNTFPSQKEQVENVAPDPKLVIPFFDKDGSLIALQGRTLKNFGLRYITLKFKPDMPTIYGYDKYKYTEKSYVTEGPLDSLFLPNSLACAGLGRTDLLDYVNIKHTTFVFDNEPRNVHVSKVMEKYIGMGLIICFWPDTISHKDVNSMVMSGLSPEKVKQLIDDNSKSGLQAKLTLSNWRV